jgi:lysophospholipase
MSSLQSTRGMLDFQFPIPIIVSDHKPVDESTANPNNVAVSGSTYVPLSAPVYEYTPFEFGSFDPQLSAFIPSEFLGTSLSSGKPVVPPAVAKAAKTSTTNLCVRGFDQLSFIMGSSATVALYYPLFPITQSIKLIPLLISSLLFCDWFFFSKKIKSFSCSML